MIIIFGSSNCDIVINNYGSICDNFGTYSKEVSENSKSKNQFNNKSNNKSNNKPNKSGARSTTEENSVCEACDDSTATVDLTGDHVDGENLTELEKAVEYILKSEAGAVPSSMSMKNDTLANARAKVEDYDFCDRPAGNQTDIDESVGMDDTLNGLYIKLIDTLRQIEEIEVKLPEDTSDIE